LYEWHKQIQIIVDEIDHCIKNREDESLTLGFLSRKLGYSEFHTSRKFKQISGMQLRKYLQLRRLAFALIEVRDSNRSFLDIAIDHGFSSHEAFSRAFKASYGVAPNLYRKNPKPVILRTNIYTFDRFILGIGEIGMVKSTNEIKIYFVSIPAHKFLYIKNYESKGYWDFWQKQDKIPGQDCDTICGLLDAIEGKLDGKDGVVGKYSGQIMAHITEDDGRCAECYGVRLPLDYDGEVPSNMFLIDIPSAEYLVFEHGPFDYEKECDSVGDKLQSAIDAFDYSETEYLLDESPGRVSFFYHDPEQFEKFIKPVKKK